MPGDHGAAAVAAADATTGNATGESAGEAAGGPMSPEPVETRTVADAVADLLTEHGVRRGYTVPGESFLGLLDALESHTGFDLISTRHESGAAFMAEAEAKLTGVPAVAMGSRGPGAANLAIGVHTAHQDQTPMLVLLGQVESNMLGREAFQEVDLAAFYAPISKWAVEARRARDVPGLVAEALRVATSGRPGPVAISVPADFWAAPARGPWRADPAPAPAPTRTSTPSDGALDRACDELVALLASAHRPVAIAGPRLDRAVLRTISERYAVGVYSAFRRQDAFDERHPHYLGHLGLGISSDVRRALDEADLVLVLGTRLDAMSSRDFTSPSARARLVMLGEGLPTPKHAGPVTVLDVDARRALARLASRPHPAIPTRDWSTAHAAWTRFATPEPAPPEARVRHTDAILALRRLAPTDTVVTLDAGNFSAFVHRYWGFGDEHRTLGPSNGAMGYAVPAAVAAKLAEPDRTAVAMVGDGGALMTGQELEVSTRMGAPVLVVIFQNGLYGTIAHHQARTHGRLAAVDVGFVELATWARGLGATAYAVDRAAECDAVMDQALGSLRDGRPAVVVCRTDPDQITADQRLSEIAPGVARVRH